jgi:hypothetical protein
MLVDGLSSPGAVFLALLFQMIASLSMIAILWDD